MRRLRLEGFSALQVAGLRIAIVTTPCHFGGERRWFLCPHCARRCAVLYRPNHRCRLCADGHYRSEHLSPLNRKIVKSRRLRRKLGDPEPNPSQPIPDKPLGMQWHSYMRIRDEILRLEREVLLGLQKGMRRQ